MRPLIFTLLLLLSHLFAMGSHITSSRIYTEPIGGNQYKLVVELYRDCSGIPGGTTVTIDASTSTGSWSQILPLYSTSSFLDSCGFATTCTSFQSVVPGLQKMIYMDTITIDSATTFSFSNCCLNQSIINISNASSSASYVECYLDPQGGTNTPVEVNNYEQLMHYNVLDSSTHSLNIYEQEGDSVVVSATSLLTSSQSPIGYNAGYSASNPFGNNLYYNVSTDGIIDMVNFSTGQYALGFKIESYRNGSLNHSQVFSAFSTHFNNPISTLYPAPTLDLVDATTGQTLNSKAPINVVAGVQYKYIVQASTLDPANITTNKYYHIPSGMTRLPGTGTNPIDTLIWTPSNAQANTYEILSLRVQDQQCSAGGYVEDEKFHFKVMTPGVTDSVWPGDVDWNLTVDMSDPVLVGVAYGTTGTTRNNASNTWIAQASADWNTSFASGINHKHADCDGNGVVDSMDLVAVSTNWGLSHNKGDVYKTNSSLPIFVSTSRNLNTEFDIDLGTSSETATDVYAVSMDLEIYNKDGSNFKNWTQYPIDLEYTSSWLDTDLLPFHIVSSQQSMGLVLTKKNQQASSGQGHLFTIKLDPSMASEYSIVKIKNAITYDHTGKAIDTLEESSTIFDLTSIKYMEENEFNIFPNPNNGDLLHLEVPEYVQGESILEIYNSIGQKVHTQETYIREGKSAINLPLLSPSSYYIHLIYGDCVWIKKYQQL